MVSNVSIRFIQAFAAWPPTFFLFLSALYNACSLLSTVKIPFVIGTECLIASSDKDLADTEETIS